MSTEFLRKIENKLVVITLTSLILSFLPTNALTAYAKDLDTDHFFQEKEIVEMRSENSKTFQIGKNRYKLLTYSDRIHYKVGSEWKEIKNEIVAGKYGEYKYTNAANDIRLFASNTAGGGVEILYKGGGFKVFISGDNFNPDSVATVDKNKIFYKEVMPGIDWELSTMSSEIRNELVVKDRRGLKENYVFNIVPANESEVEIEDTGVVSIFKNGKLIWKTNNPVVYDEIDQANLLTDVTAPLSAADSKKSIKSIKVTLNKQWIDSPHRVFPIRIDPSLSVKTTMDTFVSPSTLNPGNGWRRQIPIGTFTDYTLDPPPTFKTSRALIYFGSLNLPSNSIVTNAILSLWHYATNVGNKALYVARVTSAWDESTVWPGPSFEGDYGSATFPFYNSNLVAERRDIELNIALIDYLRSPNNGIMVRNYNENARGVVVCSRNIPSGPCWSGMEPELEVTYFLNNPPAIPNPISPLPQDEYGGGSLGTGVDIIFKADGVSDNDPPPGDLWYTHFYTWRDGGPSYESSDIYGSGTVQWTYHINDGKWFWKARSIDHQRLWGGYSVEVPFFVDTTPPTQPNMNEEPTYSSGTQNSVSSTVATDQIMGSLHGIKYRFQAFINVGVCGGDNDILIGDSGWIVDNTYTFGSLEDEVTYCYRVKARDVFLDPNKWNETSWSGWTQSTQDATPPVISDTSVIPQRFSPNGDGVSDSTVIKFKLTENHLSYWDIFIKDINGETIKTLHGDTTNNGWVERTWDGKDKNGAVVQDGTYYIVIESVDLAGNKGSDSSLVVIVDNQPPTLSISSPIEGAWFSADKTEISGITDVDAVLTSNPADIEGRTNIPVDENGIWISTWKLNIGVNTFYFESTDSVGNKATKNLTVKRENTLPVIEVVGPSGITKNNKPVIELVFSDFDEGSGASGIDLNSACLSLVDSYQNEVVLVKEGINIQPQLGHIDTDCVTTPTGGSVSCFYKYVFDQALQPDDIYTLVASIKDVAGNKQTSLDNTFEVDSHTYLEIKEPANGGLFNHSLINVRGVSERYSELTVKSSIDQRSLYIDGDRLGVSNCRMIDVSDPTFTGWKKEKEICDFELQIPVYADLENDIYVESTIEISLVDPAKNELQQNRQIAVNLFAITLAIDGDLNYISPNGDGRQDGIEFKLTAINRDTQLPDVPVSEWAVEISKWDQLDNVVRKLSGDTAVPPNIFFDGKDSNGNWLADGDYGYRLKITTTDGINLSTGWTEFFSRTKLTDKVYVTFPYDGYVTTRGVVNIQGQAPLNTVVTVCIDLIGAGDAGECDDIILANVDNNGFFTVIASLPAGASETEYYVFAWATDKYGNKTEDSNKVKIIYDVKDPFVNVIIIPSITKAGGIVIIRSEITQNTEWVKFSFADYTDLSELPEETNWYNIGGIDNNETFELEPIDYSPCDQTTCIWDYHWTTPLVTGGVYEIEFMAKKGESIQKITLGVRIDGTVPIPPTIMSVGPKIGEHFYQESGKYYTNMVGWIVEGIAEPLTVTQLFLDDQMVGNIQTNAVGLWSLQVSVPAEASRVFTLTAISEDTVKNESDPSIPVKVELDMINPTYTKIETPTIYRKAGSSLDVLINANEVMRGVEVVLQTGERFNLHLEGEDWIGRVNLPGELSEGEYLITIDGVDRAGNKGLGQLLIFIDNTPPKPPQIDTTDWGVSSGIDAKAGIPAAGRLVPGYVTRHTPLRVQGKGEKSSEIRFYTTTEVGTVTVGNDNCLKEDPLWCQWSFNLTFNEEKGYLLRARSVDQAGNESMWSSNYLLYFDKTPPAMPKIIPTDDIFDPDSLGMVTNKKEVFLKVVAERRSDQLIVLKGPNGQNVLDKVLRDIQSGEVIFNLSLDKGDGTYAIDVVSYDAPGNKSEKFSFKFEKDTTPPNPPTVKIDLCEYKICAWVEGEPNSTVFVNTHSGGIKLSSTGEGLIILTDSWLPNTFYKFVFTLEDRARNRSKSTEANFTTPDVGMGAPGVIGAEAFNPWGGEEGSFVKVKIDVILNDDGSYYFENVQIPAPILTYIDWSFSTYFFYGYGPYYGMPLEFNFYEPERWRTYTVGEALKACDINAFEGATMIFRPNAQRCLKNKLGIKSFTELGFCVFPFCLDKKGNTVLDSPKKWIGTQTTTAQHALIHVYKNGSYIVSSDGSPWRVAGASKGLGKFNFNCPISDFSEGDRASVSIKFYGGFNYDLSGRKGYLDYSGPNSWSIGVGLESPRSNEILIPSRYENIEGHTAKVLDVPYINQCLPEPNSRLSEWEPIKPISCENMCGAAVVTMTMAYLKKIPIPNKTQNIRDYMYKEPPAKNAECAGGFYQTTGLAGGCGFANYDGGVMKALGKSGTPWGYKLTNKGSSVNFDELENSINHGFPVVWHLSQPRHYTLAIGYTNDGYIVVNDSYKNLLKPKESYSFSGKHALYTRRLPTISLIYISKYYDDEK